MRTFGEASSDNYAREVGWFQRQTPLGLALKFVLVVIVISLFFGVIGFFSGWFRTGVDIVSPENVKKQWAFAYQYDESLDAIANQWCSAKKAESTAIGDDAVNQRQSQTSAYFNNYNAVKAKYDAALRNAFEAKLVAPSDVPSRAPTLEANIVELGLVGCTP